MSLILIFLCVCISSEASGTVRVKNLRYWSSEQYTRVVVDLDGYAEFIQKRLSNPDRLYFDLKDSSLSKEAPRSIPIEDGILRHLRAGQFDKNTVRVVLDLQEIESFKAFMFKDPDRLVIDVFGRKEIKKVSRVIIDPGHGGEDPGAIGPSGLSEKDVVLAIAIKLGGILKKYNLEVIFTRDKDIFIPLEKRTVIANSKNADLFISIHANASRRKNAKGVETYFLNWTSDEEAMRVAARENKISLKKMRETQQSELQFILQDMARDYKHDESLKLAGNIQSSMVNILKKEYNNIHDLGVKWALFYVLVGANMPSILVETSFISNREEEKRLSDEKYREKIAEGIAEGINSYFDSKKKLAERASDKI